MKIQVSNIGKMYAYFTIKHWDFSLWQIGTQRQDQSYDKSLLNKNVLKHQTGFACIFV